MKKLTNLRDYLSNKIPFLKENPENLSLFVENGRVITTLAKTPSLEYEYTANIIIESYNGNQDILMTVISDWLRQYQPDMLANPIKRQDSFLFDAVILSNGTAHISIDLKLTERILATNSIGKWVVESISEPTNPFDEWQTER